MGKIIQVMGPVVDVEFSEGALPTVFTALKVTNPALGETEWNLVLEVAQQLGGGRVDVSPWIDRGPEERAGCA